MNTIETDSFDELYSRAFEAVIDNGNKVESRNGPTIELQPCVMQINNPRRRISTLECRRFNIGFAVAELCWVLSGRGDCEFISHYNKQFGEYFDDPRYVTHGSYGVRYRKYGSQRGLKEPIDQLKMMFRRLQKDPNDRRAVAIVYDAELDSNYYGKDTPCNNWSHALIRENKLSWSQVVRSNDLLWGVNYNVFLFTTIQELMASWLNCDLGHYVHFSDSLHLYTTGESGEEVNTIMKNIKERHPYSNDHLFLYDHYEPSKIQESFEETDSTIKFIMSEESAMRRLQDAFHAKRISQRLRETLSEKPFWLNCARVLLSYNAMKRLESDEKLLDFALEEALRIDNEFQFSILEFMLRKNPDMLFKLEGAISKPIFEELERRYIKYPNASK